LGGQLVDRRLQRVDLRGVDGAFAQRRKTLRAALAGWAGSAAAAEEALVAAGVSPQARGEALTVEEFVRIAEHKAAPAEPPARPADQHKESE
ncbi:hypothetical protein ACFWRP_20150, partial [Streptomyces sp. NPDC058605]